MFQRRLLLASLVTFASLVSVISGQELPVRFEAETIDGEVQIGYGVATGDVDGDGKTDILLADKNAFVWYRNPDWKRFVITKDLTPLDNVCIAARDIDGDGRVEIAVGAQWNPGDTNDSGSVHYLVPQDDRTQLWKPIQLHHEPTVHRMRWVRTGEKEFMLVVAPLHGRGNRNGNGAGCKLLAYNVPNDPSDEWTTTVIDDSMHMTHNFDPCQWDESTIAEELLYIGKEGAKLIHFRDGKWESVPIDRAEGGGEIRMGVGKNNERLLVTIEPMHGDKLVVYPTSFNGQDSSTQTELTDRVVLDETFNAGHAVATGDLLGLGQDQIVAGWRSPNGEQKVGLKIYWQDSNGSWQQSWIDDNEMATEDARVADLDGDGKLDIIAAGRATKNLKVYWNREK